MLPDLIPPPAEAAPGKPAPEVEAPSQIDLASIVTSAAKGTATTVQEAPSIITIITADEIKQRGFRTIGEALATVPGWIDTAVEGNQVEAPLVRGAVQGVLYLRDGVSMFDPVFNIATLSRVVPLENIKRIEVVTGPGGVLWGANSFLGVVNVITKDADDLNTLEANVGYGTGPGNWDDTRGYVAFGHSFFNHQLKVYLHLSAETWIGETYSGQQFYASSPAPQPAGPALYGCTKSTDPMCKPASADPARSWFVNLDGKLSLGPVSFFFNLPFGELNHSLNFSGALIGPQTGIRNADKTTWNFYDRYAVLEFRKRFFGEKFGVDAKAYYVQFNRDIQPSVFVSSGALPGGLRFAVTGENGAPLLVQRVGGTLDADFAGPFTWNRVLFGAEAFNESNSTGITYFPNPSSDPYNPMTMSGGTSNPDYLPLVCPVDASGKRIAQCPLTFINAAERTVVGLFVDDQIRPFRTLTLDGGVRYQQGFGKRGYAAQFLGSAAAVWQFLPDMHLKLNYSQGFRPPVFNNTDGNGAAVEFGGNPNLQVERSQAIQAEVNARLLKNVRMVRELQVRADYSYTLLENTIVLTEGSYANSGRRGVHSVEVLGRLYLKGDHFLSVGYTFLDVQTSDVGALRSVPNHWFTLGAVFNVIRDTLDLNGNLNVFGAYEDPDRVPSGAATIPSDPNNPSAGTIHGVKSSYTDLTFDRLTPVAVLQLGARLRLWKDHLSASVQFYNVLNQRYYYPDVFYDLAPTIEIRPNPAPGFSMFASVTFRP